MKYTYTEYVRGKPITFIGNYDEMKEYLVKYCKTHIRNNVRYISRVFKDIEGSNGWLYDVSCIFDYNWNLEKYLFRRNGWSVEERNKVLAEINKKPLWEYRLDFIDFTGKPATNFADTREQVIHELKCSPNHKYTLTIQSKHQTFDVMYIPEQGLQVDGKIYKNF